VRFTAPGSGTVTAIHRGARRRLRSVIIELDDPADPGPAELHPDRGPGSRAAPGDLRGALLESGLWTAFRTRPFSRVPHSESTPVAIFVTAIDTRPLAGDPQAVVLGDAERFERGLAALTGLCGRVYLCTGPGWSGPDGAGSGVRHATFEGPHPAGLPGTHIHRLAPAGPGRTVWHIGYQDVIAVGELAATGRLLTERVVALGGSAFTRPRLLRTRLGADLVELTGAELAEPAEAAATRLISGSVLDGRTAADVEAYLGRYHLQVSAVAEPAPGRRPRWRERFRGALAAAARYGRPRMAVADQYGRANALVPVDAFERLIPMDVLTQPLLRTLLIGDTDQAQALGCLELDEEDLALCSYICPGKNDYGAVLRVNLDRIEREG
jgi:Na+-transporting NADH:ubiquinone oxidoreductase subunit A